MADQTGIIEEVFAGDLEVINDLAETNVIESPEDDPSVPTRDTDEGAAYDSTPIEVGVLESVSPDPEDTISAVEDEYLPQPETVAEEEEVTPTVSNQTTLPALGHVEAGDRVMVALVNGEATVLGTLGSGDAQVTRIANLESDYAEIGTLVAQKANVSDLQATNARVGTLETDSANVKGRLSAAEGSITNLQAKDVTIEGNLTAATGRISTLETDNTSVKGRLTAAEASISSLETSKANVTDLQATNANVTNLQASKANIDLANVSNAWIESGTIKDAAISNEMINTVSANKLTAGTIDASNITVTNLNASNITTGTINGQRIGQGSLSLDKLAESVYTQEEIDDIAEDLQDQILAQIETWTGTAVPTLNNYPANGWTTADVRKNHVGDVYYVINSALQQDGYCYRFAEGDNSTYSWVLIKDSDVTKALRELVDVKGDIGDIQSFDTTVSSFITDTTDELSSTKNRTTNLETRMTTAEGNISNKVNTSTFNTLKQTVDENSSTITTLSSTTQTLRSDLDNLEIGGRNFLLDTAPKRSVTLTSATGSNFYTEYVNESDYGKAATNGNTTDTFVMSFDWSTTSSDGVAWLQIDGNIISNIIDGNGGFTSGSTTRNKGYIDISSGSGRYWAVFRYTETQAGKAQQRVRIRVSGAEVSGKTLTENSVFTAWNFKLERGSKATDWTPAPEDAEESITTLTNTVNTVRQTAETNSSNISSLQTTVSNKADSSTVTTVTNRVSGIEQDLAGFKTTVSSTYATQSSLNATNSNVTAAQNTANTALADGTEYINGTQTAKTGSWTGVTRDATLATGKTIAYRLPYAGDGNATLNLTLNGSTASPKPTTGAKEVYLGTTRMTTHFGAGSIINMTYDGTRWRATSIPNSNNYDRRLHNNQIKAAENLNKYTICIGTSAGYKMVKANETFNLDYPPLYLNANTASGQTYAVASGASTTAMYEAIPSVTVSNTATPQGAAVNKTLWLKGTVSGNTFTCAATNFLTCNIPTSADNYYYIPLGQFANNSSTQIYFSTSTRLYAYLDGYFQAIDNAANTRATKLESTVSNHTTSISQNTTNIALKADKSTTYTKTEVDDAIDGVESTISETYATKAELEVTSDSVNVVIQETSEIRDSADAAQLAADAAAATASQAQADIDAQVSTLEKHFTFSTSGLSISNTEGSSGANILLDGSRLTFRSGTDELAYAEGTTFKAPVMDADELHLGNWMWVPRKNGNLSLKWIGG